LVHFKAFAYWVYAITGDVQLKKNKLKKLDLRAYIGYLVSYDSTNIYYVWIPKLGKVISTKDVIFDEELRFESKDEGKVLIIELEN